MLKNLLIITICLAFVASIACSSTPSANSNSANVNAPANLPPEFSANRITPGGTPTPGIPDPKNINKPPKGTTPTPGIPAPEDLGKPLPKGATPTPGIPSEDELKKMANRTVSIEEVNNPKNAANLKGDGKNPRKRKRPPQ